MRIIKSLIIVTLSMLSFGLQAQIGINNPDPDTSAVLDIKSNTQGLLVPRMTALERRSLFQPANSLLVFDETDQILFFYDSTQTDVDLKWTAVNPLKLRDDQTNFDGTVFLRDVVTDKIVRSFSIGTETINGNNDLNVNDNVSVGNITVDAPQNGLAVEGDVEANKNVTVKDTITASVLAGFGTVPLGGIIMWSGSVIPDGWQICDGALIVAGSLLGNATPNLSGRFIVGRGTINEGGAATYSFTGGIGAVGTGTAGGANNVAITTAQMPVHNHGGSTSSDGDHTHGLRLGRETDDSGSGGSNNDYTQATPPNAADITTESAGAHTHTIFNDGGGQAHENRPPYYALAYIMRIQ